MFQNKVVTLLYEDNAKCNSESNSLLQISKSKASHYAVTMQIWNKLDQHKTLQIYLQNPIYAKNKT